MSPHSLVWFALALFNSAAVHAVPQISHSEPASPTRMISRVDSEGPAGAFDGARATAFFSDGGSAQSLFVDADAGSQDRSVARTDAFELVIRSVSGAGRPDFQVTNLDANRRLVGFRVDGLGDGNGHAAVDRELRGAANPLGTVGSNDGQDLEFVFDQIRFFDGVLFINYLHPLALVGADPVGDLFGALEVSFSLFPGATPRLGLVNSTLFFSVDADLVGYVAVTPPGSVPEPGSLALLAFSLASLGCARRYRRVTTRSPGRFSR